MNFGKRRNQRGVALIMAISALALISYLAMEIMYEATVEYTVNAQALNRIKAYYAAKAGLDISLLRIKIYQTIKNKTQGMDTGPYGQYIDEIWRFPFMWPMVLPTELSSTEKDDANKLVKASLLDASFTTDIQDEGSKIDLNDLVSPSKTLREATHKRLVQIFKDKVENDEEWRGQYGAYNFDELINNIADFMSDKNTSLNGGDKKAAYQELNKDREYYPPNRGFRTLQEMRLVKDMTDEFFDILAPQVTIYGMRGINPKVASKSVLQSLDPGIDDRVYGEIDKYRTDPTKEPWKKAEDFWAFVLNAPASARLKNEADAKKIPMYFDGLISFRVKVTGEFASAKREITAIVTDLDRTATRIKSFVDQDAKGDHPDDKDDPAKAKTTDSKTSTTGQTSNPLPKGPPRIIYWSER